MILLLLIRLLLLTSIQALYIDNISYSQLLTHVQTTPTLLFITARWCDHCTALQPELSYLARHASKSTLLVARADTDEQPAISAAFRVQAYPTILYLSPGAEPESNVVEYGDYRWAEVIAEFANNKTGHEILTVPPRQRFLKWREQHPYNLGPKETRTTDEGEEVEEVLLGIREPKRFSVEDVERAEADEEVRYVMLFYSEWDVGHKERVVQWRQASSAFSGADNVTVALVDVGDEEGLRERYGVDETPRCFYLKRGKGNRRVDCDEDMDLTEDLVQFIADRVMAELGLGEAKRGKSFHLTNEQYEELKASGKVFANDQTHQDKVRQAYTDLQNPPPQQPTPSIDADQPKQEL